MSGEPLDFQAAYKRKLAARNHPDDPEFKFIYETLQKFFWEVERNGAKLPIGIVDQLIDALDDAKLDIVEAPPVEDEDDK